MNEPDLKAFLRWLKPRQHLLYHPAFEREAQVEHRMLDMVIEGKQPTRAELKRMITVARTLGYEND